MKNDDQKLKMYLHCYFGAFPLRSCTCILIRTMLIKLVLIYSERQLLKKPALVFHLKKKTKLTVNDTLRSA